MQLHRLTFRAIGPYATEHSVDFAALGRSGLFLLEGPTGSGKSTVIDALVFALYGVLAGETASDDRLHSHHAPATVEPFVELVFETAAGLHRIRRTPKWRRPKTRGTGFTQANASATLVRLATPDATDGEVLSTSTQEVGGEIARIVGLTRQQFVQTVVLPQGEFAKFLGASGEDRRLVLQSLFGTEVYDRTTAELVEARKAAHAAVADADHAVELARERLREASAGGETVDGSEGAQDAQDAQGDAAVGVPAEDDPTPRQTLVDRLDAAVAVARRARDRSAAAVAAARARLAELTQRAQALRRRTHLRARRAAHEADDAALGEDRRRLEAGRRAVTVAAPLAALRKAEARAVETARILTGVASRHPDLAALTAAEASERRDELLAELAAVEPLVALERAFDGRAAALETAAASLAELDDRVVVAGDALDARPSARLPFVSALDAARAAVRDVEPAAAAVAAAGLAVRHVAEAAELAGAASTAVDRRTGAAVAARHAVDAEAAVRRRRIEGMAGEIALSLADGEACAVCGSTSHPAPAVLTDDHPDDEAVERAAAEREAADRALALASDAAAAAEARHVAAVERLDGLDADTARAALEAAESALAAAETSAAAAGVAEARLDEFDVQTGLDRAALAGLREARIELSADLDTSRATLEADRLRVARLLGERASTVSALQARLVDDRSAVQEVLAAVRADDSARVDRLEAAASLTLAVAEAGFDDAALAEAAALDRAELAALATRVSLGDSERAVVADGLADAAVAGLDDDDSSDAVGAEIETASATLATDEARLEADSDVLGRAADRLERTRAAVAALDRAEAAAAGVEGEARAIVRMADVASASSGDNTTGVTLGTYVLLRRFDDVVAAANARLGVMSSGRYRLESSEVRESGRSRKVGLALVIRDNTTDTTRDPKSFSGGETFYASLSLALGLADVVQAEAGGLDLGTLFVDEGFGSLDPETLDAVMTELGRLSAHGRVVGIVSHVEELKQRIADRIEVRRLPDGSSTLTSTAG